MEQELNCFPHEEGPVPADVVESNSAGLGHRGDVHCAALRIVHYHSIFSRLVMEIPAISSTRGPFQGSLSLAQGGAQSCQGIPSL